LIAGSNEKPRTAEGFLRLPKGKPEKRGAKFYILGKPVRRRKHGRRKPGSVFRNL
jgi:hypothetical protein